MSRPLGTLGVVGSLLLAMPVLGHADAVRQPPAVSTGATLLSAVRTELGTSRLDAVSRTLDIDQTGHRILEASLGRVLCGTVQVETSGHAPRLVRAGEPLVLGPGSVVRSIDATSRIVAVSVIPKFDGMIP